MTKNQYEPDYLVHPSEVVKDYIEASGQTVDEFIDNRSKSQHGFFKGWNWRMFLNGSGFMSKSMAITLEEIFVRPVDFWLKLQEDYDADKRRLGR